MTKYVLCRPEGGINDMLCQIGICIRYCLKFDRVLVIDSANTNVFAEPFGRYFTIHYPRLKLEPDPEAFLKLAEVKRLTLFPDTAKLRHDGWPFPPPDKKYRTSEYMVCRESKANHEADVIVHHFPGGGRPDPKLLRSIRLTADYARTIALRWRSMPKPYVGVHVRNTDYKSDPEVIAPIIRRYQHPVYLATDSADAQRLVKAMGHQKVWTSPIPDFGGNAIHKTPVSVEEKSRLNRLALEDLIMLGLAEKVYVSNPHSGFSDLAKSLNAKQSMVIDWFDREHVGTSFILKLRLNWLRNMLLRVLRH